jgi:two-component system, cell cycle sensor histidine kinase and response regulator CckA
MTDDLRRRAEDRAREIAAETPEGVRTLSSEESRIVLHDLRVHQIELEMQNEELRQTQVELEASRARYFDLYDLAPVGYFTISDKGLILEANFTAATLFGVARGALVKQPLTRFIVPEDQDRYYLHRRRLFATGAPQVLDLRLKRGNGTHFWARFEATTAQDVDDGTEVCRAVVSDISERKHLEDERLRFEQELRLAQKAESLARMAGAIAHHFNNQLAVVMGNLELSMGSPSLAARQLTDAMDATRKAAEVSRLLLTYLGQSSGNHAPLDISEACRRMLPMIRAAMPTGVALETDLPAPGPVVNGNANQLQLVVTNLITNAWEAVGDLHTPIHLSVKTVSASDISTANRFAIGWRPRDQDYACLDVTDTGCGLEEQEIEKIFEPFFTTKFTGRGLGLPVVLGILHAHSGGLVVESNRGLGNGSTFRVYLPVSTEELARPPGVAAQSAELGEIDWAGTVVLVEDDEVLRRTVATTLARLGFMVLDAPDGTEAVELFRRHKDTIRFVICDLTMPHMDGWETLTALRKLAPGIPIILTSGYDEAHVMADDFEERPQAFLGKPYEVDALRDAIRRALATPKHE